MSSRFKRIIWTGDEMADCPRAADDLGRSAQQERHCGLWVDVAAPKR